jgi:hypothetical protein
MEPISDAHKRYLDNIIENYTATPKYDSEFLNYALRPVVPKNVSCRNSTKIRLINRRIIANTRTLTMGLNNQPFQGEWTTLLHETNLDPEIGEVSCCESRTARTYDLFSLRHPPISYGYDCGGFAPCIWV